MAGVVGVVALAGVGCDLNTEPFAGEAAYLPLVGGRVTGDVAVEGKFEATGSAPGAALLTVDPSGNVGVGASEPASWLHVRGEASALGDGIRVDRDGQCGALQYAQLSFRGGRARLTSTVFDGPGCNIGAVGNVKGGFSFTALNAEGPVDRMTIDEEGKVGIGTAMPAATLHVQGAQSGVLIDGSGVAPEIRGAGASEDIALSAVGPGGHVFIRTQGADRVFVQSSGLVGIGTNAPAAPLDINGDSIRLRMAKVPATATSPCTVGEISWGDTAIYVCVANNQWKKAALTTF